MCGIVAIIPVRNKDSLTLPQPAKELATRILSTSLLLETEERGKDASGTTVHFWDNNWMLLKQPVASSEFTLNMGQDKYTDQEAVANYHSFMKQWRRHAEKAAPTSCFLGHARKKTVGTEYTAENNHPINIGGNIIGVHNGRISNDTEIFKVHSDIKRIAQVDSEAIFQLINSIAPDAPPSLELMREVDSRLRGEYAFLYYNVKFPGLVAGFRRDRPIDTVRISNLGLILVASERKFIDKSIEAYNRTIMSVSGFKLPAITSKVTEYESVVSDGACCFDGRQETDTVKACYKELSVGGKTSSSYKANKSYDYASTTTTTSTYNSGSTWDHTKVEFRATVEDLTEYTVSPKQEKVQDSIPAARAVVLAKAVKSQTLGPILSATEVLSKSVTDNLYKEAEDEMYAQMVEATAWVSSVNVNSVRDVFGIPPLLGFDSDAEDQSFMKVFEKTYEEAYTEGYVSAAKKYVSPAIAPYRKKAQEHQETLKKMKVFIANLKVFVTAALLDGGNIQVSDDNDQVLFSESVINLAKTINPKFKVEHIVSMFSHAADIHKISSLLCDMQEYNNDADDDEAEFSGPSVADIVSAEADEQAEAAWVRQQENRSEEDVVYDYEDGEAYPRG